MGVPKKEMVALIQHRCLEEKKTQVVCSMKLLEDRLHSVLESHSPKCQRFVDSVVVAGSASAAQRRAHLKQCCLPEKTLMDL